MSITEKEKKSLNVLLDFLTIITGTVITAVSLNMMTIPAGLLAGGLTGIAQFIHYFFPINVGIFYFILNVPLMIAAYLTLGKKFSFYTILSITILSLFLYIFPIKHLWTENVLLAAIFGGILNGIGCGIILRRGGSTGGLDILSRIIAKYSNVSVGRANLGVNIIIVIASGFIFGGEIALYTIVSMFASMKTYDVILNHVDRISVLIVTEKGEEVNKAISEELHRGITMWDAHGGYTHKQKNVLLCVTVKGQLPQLKKIVKRVDSQAFVSVISTQKVIGHFNKIW